VASVVDVELATLGWVHWHNSERLHGFLGDVPPAEFEARWFEANNSATLHSPVSDETDPAPIIGAAQSAPTGG
jgi:hypothetical protein